MRKIVRKKPFRLQKRILFRYVPFVLALLSLSGTVSCVFTGVRPGTGNMTVADAEKVAVRLQKRTFQPPPRKIGDVLALLDQKAVAEPEILMKAKEIANLDCSSFETDSARCGCLIKRGVARYHLGKTSMAQKDLRKGIDMYDRGAIIDADLITAAFLVCETGDIEAENGNLLRGIELVKKGNKIHQIQRLNGRRILAEIYSMMGDYKSADKYLSQAIWHCDRLIAADNGRKFISFARDIYMAKRHRVRGEYALAEKYFKKAIKQRSLYFHPFEAGTGSQKWRVEAAPGKAVKLGIDLSDILILQGKLTEAEQIARDTLKDSIAFCGKESGYTGKTVGLMAKIKLAQGNVEDADKLVRAQIRLYESIGIPSNSRLRGEAQALMGDILTARLKFKEAAKVYRIAKGMLEGNQYYFQKVIQRNPNRILSLLKTGSFSESMEIVPSLYANMKEYFGDDHYHTAETLAFRAMAFAMAGKHKLSLDDFSSAMSVLFDDAHESELNFPVKQRRTTIAHFYIDYLSRRSHRQDSSLDVNTLDTTFLLVQKLQKSTLIKASNATMARSAAAYDEKLFNLVRKEQDLGIQMKGIQAALADVISVVDNPRRKALISAHKEELETVRQARTAIQNEIKSRFPRYTNFIHPQPIRIETIQKSLGPEESMLVVYPTKDWTYVWAISKQGPVRFNKVGIKQTELAATVRELRRSLVPESEFIHDWPSFDIQSAFILYEKILKPVEDAWNGKKELFLMVSGALGQLPFSLLPTAPQELSLDGDVLFTEYRKIPWLIRKIALTRIPSVHSLVAARQQQSIVRPERQFAGFGDPLFSPNAVATADQQRETSQVASRGGRLKLRGIRVTAKGNLDDSSINSIQMSKLIRLPDTADEIKAIAEILNADFHSDIFLGANASEGRVKSLDLSNRRNIVFASHGLLPGDLDGLYEPAIALSSPLVTKEDEDGLLTMSEVLTLKLNADWVVLSACNTGAGDGKGTEAVTGLGQAFIYAGSRALLVSMWPVETTSAQKITTGLFQYQKENPAASKGQALQQVMLDLLDRQELRDQETGQIQASYAHPLFWAPFIVFGEGGI